MRKIYMLIAVVTAMLAVSCSTQRGSLVYFEDLKENAEGEIPMKEYRVTIVPDDELFISVNSLVPEASAQYNLPLKNPAQRGMLTNSLQPSQQTYIVNKDGYINFPVLGMLKVEGMTPQELAKYIEERVSADVTDPIVLVDLVNFRVNVLGEVARPGAQFVTKERFTLLDALASAGDMTVYGERENVLLIREENGKLTYHHFNLNDSKTLESPYFFLKQNDVIVVEPNEIKKDNSKYNQFNSYKISVVSTVVSACSVIASLVIALTVK